MAAKSKTANVGGGVFEDLGFSPEQAALLRLKVELQTAIVKQASRYSRAELAHILNEHQPRISDLMTGKVSKFSLDKLVVYAQKLRLALEIQMKEMKPARLQVMHTAV